MKQIKDIILRPETTELPEENIGDKLLEIDLGNNFLNLTTKAKINLWNYIKLKTFLQTKKTINKMRRQLTKWEKILANYYLINGWYPKYI